MSRFEGKTVIVTGVASGIGRATAQRLLDDGATVVGCDLTMNTESLDGTAGFTFIAADVTDEDAVSAVFEATPQRIDSVVHSAGVAGGGPVHLLPASEWQRVIDINLTGTFLVAKAAVTRMLAQDRLGGERGSIVTPGVGALLTVAGDRPSALRVSNDVRRRWRSFSSTGCPGKDWPAYVEPTRAVMVFDRRSRVEQDPNARRRLAWSNHPLAL